MPTVLFSDKWQEFLMIKILRSINQETLTRFNKFVHCFVWCTDKLEWQRLVSFVVESAKQMLSCGITFDNEARQQINQHTALLPSVCGTFVEMCTISVSGLRGKGI